MQLTIRMPDDYTERLNSLSKNGTKEVGCGPPSPLTKTDPFMLVRNDPWNAQLIGWWFLI